MRGAAQIVTILAVAVVLSGRAMAESDPIALASDLVAGTVDVGLLGQSFTISDTVEVSCIEVFVRRVKGGCSFRVFLQPFDPWTNTRGTPMATVQIPLEAVPTDPAGGWVQATLEPAVTISQPGVHAVFVDSDSDGSPDGYNDYGYVDGDSIEGGRIIGPIFGSGVEMAFRLRGTANAEAFRPPTFRIPRLEPPVLEERYTASGFLMFATFSWDTEPGAVYRAWVSHETKYWFNSDWLGDGSRKSSTRTNEYWDTMFFKVEVIPLGDYRK